MVDEMTEARFGTQRPVLHPRQALILEQGATEVDWDTMREISIKVVNAGPGVAMNVCGVFMDHCHNPQITDRRFSYMRRDILLATEERIIKFERGGTLVNGEDEIGGIKVGPSERETSFQNPSPFVIGRLTITYSDIFGRKHATSIDYTKMERWEDPQISTNIPQGIDELETIAQAAHAPTA